ncbi:MAG TPA: hypothetical protein VFA75_05150 [Nevskia sp.]|jgi:hypothetical protein|nr:hypothetical protein [Nevskia sp.]
MIRGGCHCGAIAFEFDTALAPAQLPLRRCTCSFCRRHGARTTSDPQGQVRILPRDHTLLRRYRFGLRSADFLLCGNCGAYLGAAIGGDGQGYVTLNANCFDEAEALTQAAQPVNYEDETAAQRLARRQARWTPALLPY